MATLEEDHNGKVRVMGSEEPIEAVAERWRTYRAGGKLLDQVYGGIHHDELGVMMVERQRLADYGASRLASDRAEAAERASPIDVEWLRSIGWKAWDDDRDELYHGDLFIEYAEWLSWTYRLVFHLGSIEAVRMGDPDDDQEELSSESVLLLGQPSSKLSAPTRGQLLDLIRALKGGE